VPPPEVIGVRESLMLLVNSYILKVAMILKPSTEYNRRAAHRRPSCWAFSNGNNSVLWRSTVYDVVAKYMALEQSNEGSSIPVCEEESFERTHREDPCNQRA